MEKVTLTQQEIWSQTKHKIYKSKKQYSRKTKHPKKDV